MGVPSLVTWNVLNGLFIYSFTRSNNIMESVGSGATSWCLSVILFSPALKTIGPKHKHLLSSEPKKDSKSQVILCKLFWITNKRVDPLSDRKKWRFRPQMLLLSPAKVRESVRSPCKVTPGSAGQGRPTPQSRLLHPLGPVLEVQGLQRARVSPNHPESQAPDSRGLRRSNRLPCRVPKQSVRS